MALPPMLAEKYLPMETKARPSVNLLTMLGKDTVAVKGKKMDWCRLDDEIIIILKNTANTTTLPVTRVQYETGFLGLLSPKPIWVLL